MNAIEDNRYTDAWRTWGAQIPAPRAILAISAHWYIRGSAVTAMPSPRTIHDFGGFPRALFEVEYPAPGDPALAEEVCELVRPTQVALDTASWGLDHGTWSVLCRAFPQANVPVVQLSIDLRQGFDFHFALGAKLAPLRDRGILIVGSGNVVHNLGAIRWAAQDTGMDWAQRFDAAARAGMIEHPAELPLLAEHPDFALAVPTPDHFIPLLYIAGLAAADSGARTRAFAEGCTLGSLSMTSYALEH